MPLTEANRIPTATFRVQLNAEFTFRQLEAQVGYLRSLGISDFYLSPIFTAQAGSTHGYDVNDYTRISDELGGSAAFERLADQVKEQGGGLLVDLVPNHMGIAGDGNAWWQEVLEFGPASDYAPFFDIDWQAAGGRVLLPILEHRYGRELEAGKLSVRFAGQRLGLGYGEIRLPLRPASQAEILRALAGISQLTGDERAQAAAFADQLAAEPDRQRTRKLELQVAEWRATRPGAQDALEVHLRRLNGLPGNAPSLRELDALIDRQHYRLVRWKAGVHEINYRRFFAIASLVGLRMENPAVFRETHRLLETLLKAGRVTGLRIDHIDGLREPEDYLRRLQGLARPAPDRPLYVVVEKILAPPDETLPDSWPVQGTTGYEFIFQVAGLLVDPAAEARITATYRRVTGESAT